MKKVKIFTTKTKNEVCSRGGPKQDLKKRGEPVEPSHFKHKILKCMGAFSHQFFFSTKSNGFARLKITNKYWIFIYDVAQSWCPSRQKPKITPIPPPLLTCGFLTYRWGVRCVVVAVFRRLCCKSHQRLHHCHLPMMAVCLPFVQSLSILSSFL